MLTAFLRTGFVQRGFENSRKPVHTFFLLLRSFHARDCALFVTVGTWFRITACSGAFFVCLHSTSGVDKHARVYAGLRKVRGLRELRRAFFAFCEQCNGTHTLRKKFTSLECMRILDRVRCTLRNEGHGFSSM